jgi:hypothetical protein
MATHYFDGYLMNNRYEVVRKLGEGGEAVTYLVRDKNEHNME